MLHNTILNDSGPFRIQLTAHSGPEGNFIMVEATCTESPSARNDEHSHDLAIVLDRSGSMQGQKLAIARRATADFIRSLRRQDRVAVVTYDDKVTVLSGPAQPSEELAQAVERIHSGGSTDLYGGWVTGAKLLKAGGRVLLLSDGQANVGRCTNAGSLSMHAGISHDRFRITTSTVGVGEDYDEAIMAGMANKGGGAHYFAHSADAIRDAFGQERFSIQSVVASFVSLRINGATRQLGHFWGGETKRLVIPVERLDGKASIRFTLSDQTQSITLDIQLPESFGVSPEATLELLVEQASEVEARAVEVQDPGSAGRLREEVRNLLLKVMAHPLSETVVGRSVHQRLTASHDRLEKLERNYDVAEASVHRKRSMQSSYNLRERAKSFSSFADEEMLLVSDYRDSVASPEVEYSSLDTGAVSLASPADWRRWRAVPLKQTEDLLVIGMDRPKAGFVIHEIEAHTRKAVQVQAMAPREVDALLVQL